MTQDEIKESYLKICNLRSRLLSSVSPIGDWKIIKCLEAQLVGEEMPYDLTTLRAQRQEVRKQINTLEEQYTSALEETES